MANAKTTLEIKADPSHVASVLEVIGRHATACAAELRAIDGQPTPEIAVGVSSSGDAAAVAESLAPFIRAAKVAR